MEQPISQVKPLAAYLEHENEINDAINKVLRSGHYILGQQVAAFEEELADSLSVSNAIAVGCGTDALQLGLLAHGIGPDDVVITASHTAVATVAAIELCGAHPLLIDIDPESFTISPALLEETIATYDGPGEVRAIIPVHIYGHAADMRSITDIAHRHGIFVLEDCAQAQGAKYMGLAVGSLGDAAILSFYPTKNLGAFGDGGALISNNSQFSEKAMELRQYGWKERFISHSPGMNTRLDELQAGILRVQLRHLEPQNERRREIAQRYNRSLNQARIETPRIAEDIDHVFHQYVIQSEDRASLMSHLKKQKIGVAIHYPTPIHQQPAYLERIAIGAGGMTHTEAASKNILSLPMYPQLTDSEVDRVCDEINQWQAR